MSSEFVSVIDLTENPPYGAQQAVREELFSLEQRIKAHMDTGLTQDEMTVARALRDAVYAATAILDNLFQ